MEARPKQYYEITFPQDKNTTRHVYVNPNGFLISPPATAEDKERLLREISTLLAIRADYYIERIVPSTEGCGVQFLDLSQKSAQYQQKLFRWEELRDNPLAIVTRGSLEPTVQSAASLAARTAAQLRDSAGAREALHHKAQLVKAVEEKAKLVEEAKIKAEMEILFKQSAKEAEAKAKKEAADKVIVDREAGKKFFEFNPKEDKVKDATKMYEDAKFADRLKELKTSKAKIATRYLETILLEKEQQFFSARIKAEKTTRLVALKEKERAITEKLEQHSNRIALAHIEAESAFETAYNHYDQSIVSQQRTILLKAIDAYQKTRDWKPDAVRTLALALLIDPKGIRFEYAAADFYNALKKKTREEMATLFVVMHHSLSGKIGGEESYKKHPFVTLFKASYVAEQKERSESSVKEDAAKSLFSLRTAAEEKITGMCKEIEQDLTAYQESLTEYDQFLAKERDDFITIQQLLGAAKEPGDAVNKPIAELSRLATSVAEMQKEARALQAAITAKEQEFKLSPSDQGEMARFAELTQSAIVTINEEKNSFIREQKQLTLTLSQADISLEQAQQAVVATQGKQATSLQKAQQQEKMTEAALQKIQIRHDRVLAEAAIEAKKNEMREKLYSTLETILIDQVAYWKKQQSIIGGVSVLEDNGKKTNVPTGIGEMIKAIDERRKPLVTNEKKSISISSFFKNKAIPIPRLAERKIPAEIIMRRLIELKKIAKNRLEKKDFLGRTKKQAGRTNATTDFYKKLMAISDTDLADVTKLEAHIKAFDESIAKQAQKVKPSSYRK